MTLAQTALHDAGRIRTAALPVPVNVPGDVVVHMGLKGAVHVFQTCPASLGMLSAAASLIAASSVLIDVSLVDRVRLDPWFCAVTSPPMVPFASPASLSPPEVAEVGGPMARRAVEELKAAAQLTNDEVAALAGVSRRSVQSWLADGAISGPRERHLRSVVEAVRGLAAPDAVGTRARLFDRAPGHVCPFDLLVEGRFGAAVSLATGQASDAAPVELYAPSDLAIQFDRREDRVDVPERALNRVLSGRLRR